MAITPCDYENTCTDSGSLHTHQIVGLGGSLKQAETDRNNLDLPATMRIHDVFHPSLLSLAHNDPMEGRKLAQPPSR